MQVHTRINSTMVQLQRQALLRIYDVAAVDPTDPVSFGKHGIQTCEELAQQYPDYCTWVSTTAKERECHPLLRRLGTWLAKESELGHASKQIPSSPKAKNPPSPETSSGSVTQEVPAGWWERSAPSGAVWGSSVGAERKS